MPSVLDDLRSGRTLVLSHRNADIDALGSSIALAFMFPGVTVGAVESLSRGAQNLLRNFEGSMEVLVDPAVDDDMSPYDRIVFVDTANPSQVEPYDRFLSNAIVIDHHAKNHALASVNPTYVCDPDSPSCAQIVFRLALETGAEVGRDAALALVSGVLADTERFRIAPNSALRDALDIMDKGGLELIDVVAAIERPMYDRSQIIANLKAARRLEHFEMGPFLLVRTRVGAFEASAARHLVAMGADVALAASEDGGTTSVTGRVSRRALGAGFHLGEFFQALAERTGGDGGGHRGAAGFKASLPVEAVEAAVLELASELLATLPDPERSQGDVTRHNHKQEDTRG
jgi:nanoRNase/pAp phosphatase (c-di-AMP/oligoRNAs hydrolase)